jgi:hypothetical protein
VAKYPKVVVFGHIRLKCGSFASFTPSNAQPAASIPSLALLFADGRAASARSKREREQCPSPRALRSQHSPHPLLLSLPPSSTVANKPPPKVAPTHRSCRKRAPRAERSSAAEASFWIRRSRAGDIDPQPVNSPTETSNSLPPLYFFYFSQPEPQAKRSNRCQNIV